MKNKRIQEFFLIIVSVVILSGCATGSGMQMKNIKTSSVASAVVEKNEDSGRLEMLIKPHQTLGLEPTESLRDGNITVYNLIFPKRLLGGEFFLGTIRWNLWIVKDDGIESFGQVLFSGYHPSGDLFGIAVLDGEVRHGQMVILSTDMNYIYGMMEKEIAIDRQKFLSDPIYRKEKIKEANNESGKDLDISFLAPIDGFKEIIKSWNQIKFPEGYIISPYGVEEVALVRGRNPQYSYFEKLVGTGQFAVRVGVDPASSALISAIGIAMDLIRAAGAPSKGRDFSSVVLRREQSFAIEYLLRLSESEIKKRNEMLIKKIERSSS